MKKQQRGGSSLAGITMAVILLASTAGYVSALSRMFQAPLSLRPVVPEEDFLGEDTSVAQATGPKEAATFEQALGRTTAAWLINALPGYSSGQAREMWYLSLDQSGDRHIAFDTSGNSNPSSSSNFLLFNPDQSSSLTPTATGFVGARTTGTSTAPVSVPDAEVDWGNTATSWTAGASWVGGTAPAPGDVAWFKVAEVTNPALGTAAVSISGLYFSSAASSGYSITRTSPGAFTLTGFATSIGAETGDSTAVAIGANNTSGTNSIAVPITLAPSSGTTSTIFQAAGGQLTLTSITVISGTGIALNLTGGGTISFAATSNYTGGTTIAGPTVINGQATTPFGTGTLELNSGTLKNSTASTTRTLANLVSITGDFTFDAGGATGNNTFTGGGSTTGNRILTVNTSTTSFTTLALTLGGDLTSAGSGALTLSGGLNLGAADRTITGGTTGATTVSGSVDSSAGGHKLVLAGDKVTVGPVTPGASNAVNFEVNANGTVTFTGASTYVGTTTLTMGGLSLGSSSVLAGGALASGPVGTGTFHIGSGTNAATLSTNVSTSTTRTVQNNISLDGDVTFAPGSGQTTGRIALDVFTGLTTANTFSLTRTNQLTVSTGETVDLIGAISGTGFGFTKLGAGTLNLGNGLATDPNANTYSGLTTISAGLVNLRKTAGTDAIAGNVLVNGTGTLSWSRSNQINDTADVTVNDSGILSLTNNSETIDALNGTSGASILLGSGTLTVGANNETSFAYAGSSSGTGGLTKVGTGTFILSGANAYTGNTTIKAGELLLTPAGSLAATSTIHLGDTIANSPSAMFTFGSTSGGITLANPLMVDASASGSQGIRTLLGLATSGNTNTYSGTVTMNADLTVQSAAVGSTVANGQGILLFQGGSIDVGTSTLTVNTNLRGNNADTYSIQGIVTINELLSSSQATGGSLFKDGSGTLILQGTSNTYTGTSASALNANGTRIGGGILGIFGDGSLGLAPTNGTDNVFFVAPGTTTNVDSIAPTLRADADGITLSSTRNINIATGVTGQINTNGNTFTVAGIVDGPGNLAKIGAGTLILSGNNTYTGTTAVNAGTVLVNGNQSAATGAVSVNNSGTTLGGNGIIGGSVTVNSGANLAPGSSTGIITTGSVTLNSGSNFVLQLNNTTAGTGYDQLVVNGSVTLNMGNIVVVAGAGLNIGDKFFVVVNDGTDPVLGTFAQGATVTSGSDTFLINYLDDSNGGIAGNDISLTLQAIPEPSTWIGAALALGAIALTQRRKLRSYWSSVIGS